MLATVLGYHDETKHHFHRFARSRGHLDWSTQPHPFRHYEGARAIQLERVGPGDQRPVAYGQLFVPGEVAAAPLDARAISEFLRFALGLSAWKRFGPDRWALRVNPSSGNLHPTEGYVILPAVEGWGTDAGVYHYVSESHLLEQRCRFDEDVLQRLLQGNPDGSFLAGLTSIHWREAWKYGERAFRYCQHDVGHAVAALRLSAALLGWDLRLLPNWSHQAIATVLGLDREEDFAGAEHEEPDCLMLVTPSNRGHLVLPTESAELVGAARSGQWQGRANRLSAGQVDWPIIEEVARATRRPAASGPDPAPDSIALGGRSNRQQESAGLDARRILLQRRSAVAYDGVTQTSLETFVAILRRTLPQHSPPWDALWWPPAVHLALFVHRVDGLAPGLYLLFRRDEAAGFFRSEMQKEWLWQHPAQVPEDVPLVLLAEGDCRELAARLSCGQDIAGDSFLSLGMIAEFESSLERWGPWFYRNLFWESGVIGQALYLEAEAAGARGTGIGCFFDDPVHEVLGLTGHAFQSLYHFTLGAPVEDRRMTTAPGYDWEL
jgi:SagB-type dehydrogenase family enzyme